MRLQTSHSAFSFSLAWTSAIMHFLKALVGVTALLSTSAVGANIPSSDVEARSNLEARTYPSSVDQCKKDLKLNRNFEFCSAF